MRASRTLPEGYRQAGRIVLAGNRRLIYGMTASALAALVVCCAGFAVLAGTIRPELSGFEMSFSTPGEAFAFMGGFLAALALTPALVCVLHELVHGLGFWCFTRSRPRFGFTGWYAYATAPGWYLPRNQMLVVALAPLVTLTGLGFGLALAVPPWIAPVLLLGAAMNASGAVGDIYFAAHLLKAPATALAEDSHEAMTWYAYVGGGATPRHPPFNGVD